MVPGYKTSWLEKSVFNQLELKARFNQPLFMEHPLVSSTKFITGIDHIRGFSFRLESLPELHPSFPSIHVLTSITHLLITALLREFFFCVYLSFCILGLFLLWLFSSVCKHDCRYYKLRNYVVSLVILTVVHKFLAKLCLYRFCCFFERCILALWIYL